VGDVAAAVDMNLALFDFDGTITTRDTFVEFVRFAVAPTRWRAGTALLSPWIAGYRLGLVPAHRIRAAISRVAFRGAAEHDLNARGRAFASERIPRLLRKEAQQRIQWHRAQGDKIVVVSASLDVYLKHWCEEHGLDVLCTTLEMKDGTATGRYIDGDCSGARKKHEILSHYNINQFSTIYAYGDTREDLEMLDLADHRFFRWEELKEGVQPN
jgi:HAD superfamily hydrolase (TIGR01490 family)